MIKWGYWYEQIRLFVWLNEVTGMNKQGYFYEQMEFILWLKELSD